VYKDAPTPDILPPMGPTLEILLILVLVLFNGVLAMSEIALVSSRNARLSRMAKEGSRGARVALELSEDPGRFLSTIQIGITLVGILAGAFGGATLSKQLGALLSGLPGIGRYAEPVAFALVVMAITYLSLIVGELVPKQLALNAPEKIAAALALPLRLLARVTAPAVHLLDLSSRVLLRLLGSNPSTEPPVTDEELRHIVESGRRAGVFERAEQEIVERVIRLGDRRVGDLLTPRSQLVSIDVDDSPDVQRRKMAEARHTFYPVYQGSLDHVLGLVSVKDVFTASMEGGAPFDLRTHLVEPLYLPESLSGYAALERFRDRRAHAALVVDEYGGIEGIVTLIDLLEALVGELPTPEEPEVMIVRREDGSLLLDGLLPESEVASLLSLGSREQEEAEEYLTLGGLVMGRLGHIPEAGESFEWAGWRFEVMDMDRHRVDKVLVERAGEEPPDESPPAQG
jgi:putative hemolysin